jgi:tetratricopeptide (TPR) repeat protein
MAYNNIGMVYSDQGMFEEALKWFDEAIRVDPNYDTSYYLSHKCSALWELAVKAGGGDWYREWEKCKDILDTTTSTDGSTDGCRTRGPCGDCPIIITGPPESTTLPIDPAEITLPEMVYLA